VKKIIATSVLAAAALFPAIAQAEGPNLPANMSADQTVEIRKGATTAYPIVTSIKQGQSVKIIDEFTNAAGQKWYRVDLGNVKGWGLAELFSASQATGTIETGKMAVITADQVNVRKGATTAYDVAIKLSKGNAVKVLDSFTNSLGELWYRIEFGSTKGWVIQDYISPSDDYKPAPPVQTQTKTVQVDRSPVRKGATDSYQVVTYVSKNQKLTIIDTFKNSQGETWYRADLGKIKGWIHEKAFDATQNPKPPSPPAELPEIGSLVYSQIDGLDVRKGALPTYPSVIKLSANQQVKVIDHFVHKDGTAWLRLEVNPSLMGWVPAASVSKEKALNITLFVNVDVANLRSGPSLNDSVVDQAKRGEQLHAVESQTDLDGRIWYHVMTSSGQLAWVSETVVSEDSVFEPGAIFIVGASNISLRSGATNSYPVREVLKKGTKATLLGDFTNAAGEKWFNIKSSSGKAGWISNSSMNSLQLLKKELVAPSVSTVDGNQMITWKKASKFDISYSTLSSNRLKISGGLTGIDIPSGKVKGIQSIEPAGQSVIVTFEPGYSFTIRDYSDKVTVKAVPYGLAGKTIIVDAGHGGKDTGAIGPKGTREKDVVLATAILLGQELEKYGANVVLTRSTDIFLELSERTQISNASQADAFISVHADSFSSTSKGSTTYLNTTVNFNGPRSQTMAESVQKNMVSSLKTYNRGVKEQNFYVNRMNELPSILVELAFISNPNEEALLRSDEFRRKAAVGITKGLEEYFNKF